MKTALPALADGALSGSIRLRAAVYGCLPLDNEAELAFCKTLAKLQQH